jgi:hypothetical protein
MNNSELEKKLKAARGPVLNEPYRQDFAQKVLANLRSASWNPKPPQQSWWPRLAWGLSFAACILIAFVAGHWHGQTAAEKDILANTKLIQETLAEFPHRVRAIVSDEQGIKLVLSNDADVPNSPPIYVRICDGTNCSSFVTFSGQEIQLAGQKLTVLSEADGGIILEGSKFVWSNGHPLGGQRNLKIQAKNLGPITM